MRYFAIIPFVLLLTACGSKAQHEEASQFTNAGELADGNRTTAR